MTIKLPYPTMSSQTKDKDMIELKKYLFRLIEELNNHLNTILTYSGAIDASNTNSSTFVGVLNQAMNNLALELRAMITTNNRQVESEITDIQRNYVKTSDYNADKEATSTRISTLEVASSMQTMTDDVSTLPNLPSEWPENGTGRVIIYGNDSMDKYYVLFSTSGGMWNGYKNTTAENITWYSK